MESEEIIKQLTLSEKVSLCIGGSLWRTASIPRLNIPPILMIDGPHGINLFEINDDDQYEFKGSKTAISFPSACCTCCSYDPEIMFKMGQSLGEQMICDGINLILGPGVNIKRSPLCGRNFEYFSEDPILATEIAGSFIKGIQSKGVGSCIKHFAANNQETRRFFVSSQIDERTFHEIYLTAFEGAVKKAHPWAIMSSYNLINGVQSSVNYELLTGILRDDWKWTLNENDDQNSPPVGGMVISDWYGTYDRIEGFKAGLDLSMPNEALLDQVVEAVQSNELDEKYVDKAASHVLNVVLKARELIEKAKSDKSIHYGVGMDTIEGFLDAQHEVAREVAENSIVLLKNDGSLLPLPLKSDTKKIEILFVGKFAKNPHFQGLGSAHIEQYKIDNCYDCSLELIRAHNKDDNSVGVCLNYVDGYDTKTGKTNEEMKEQAITASEKADIVVVFAGTPETQENENKDLTEMILPPDEEDLIDEIVKVNDKVVVVLQNGAPVEMPWIDKVQALLETYLCGEAGGKATANILFGLVNPSGHLGESFPIKVEDNPSFYNFPGHGDTVEYSEGIFVGYRYYDTYNKNVLFPFGYGLSYTTFKFTNIRFQNQLQKATQPFDFIDTDPNIIILVDVTNTGLVEGKAVGQLYICDQTGVIIRPMKELKGFKKVNLSPGETKTIQFHLNQRSFAFWNNEIHDWCVASGNFVIIVGQSSRDYESLMLTLRIKSSAEELILC